MEKTKKMRNARMKKWMRERAAMERERVTTPRYGWKSMSLRARTSIRKRLQKSEYNGEWVGLNGHDEASMEWH